MVEMIIFHFISRLGWRCTTNKTENHSGRRKRRWAFKLMLVFSRYSFHKRRCWFCGKIFCPCQNELNSINLKTYLKKNAHVIMDVVDGSHIIDELIWHSLQNGRSWMMIIRSRIRSFLPSHHIFSLNLITESLDDQNEPSDFVWRRIFRNKLQTHVHTVYRISYNN